MYDSPIFLNAGDKAIVAEFADSIEPHTNRIVHALNEKIISSGIDGIIDTVPSYRSILIMFDPLKISSGNIQTKILEELEILHTEQKPTKYLVHIPTLYGGNFGPDLSFISQHTKIEESEIIKLHSSINYLVYMMGFSPGFPYLGGLPSKLATPRMSTPRSTISGGSVGIAENQTGIYPVDSPGGWRIIGRTPVKLFDQNKIPPTLLIPGNFLKFDPLPDLISYNEIESKFNKGQFDLVIEDISEQ